MQSVAFTHRLTDIELAHQDGRHAWRHLENRLASYLAEHLPQAGYQLFRVSRASARNHHARETVLTLTLEVGQVTEHRCVTLALPPEPVIFDDHQPPHALTPARRFNAAACFEKMQELPTKKPTSEGNPKRRHILVDKQPQPA